MRGQLPQFIDKWTEITSEPDVFNWVQGHVIEMLCVNIKHSPLVTQ